MPTPAETEGLLIRNGIAARTGEPFFPPVAPEELLARVLGGEGPGRRHLAELDARRRWGHGRSLGPKHGVDPRRLGEAGWGVIFAEQADAAVRQALAPLLRRRRRQAARLRPERYRELAGREGYRRGESKLRFLARHGVGPGPADPDRMPYYLLLVGGPEEIPWSFQTQLDVQYAVGRLAFDTPEEYARYAAGVVAAERGSLERPRRTVLFGTRRTGDLATELMHDELVLPVAARLAADAGGWQTEEVAGAEATRPHLARLLGGDETPALLFTACHGLCYERGDRGQRDGQGALVCQRPEAGAPHDGPPAFAAADLGDDACPGGLVLFAFACFSAGTPGPGEPRDAADELAPAADRPFVSRLAQRLLAHPRGGALAVVGHVDQAWTYSFRSTMAGAQTEVFLSTLRRLRAGYPLGSAMEFFDQRHAELACELAALRERLQLGGRPDAWSWTDVWTACHDARNFVILGDPAVKLAAASRGGRAAR